MVMTKRVVLARLAGLALLLTLLIADTPLLSAGTTHTVSDCGDSGGAAQLRNTVAIAGAGDTINIVACTITLTTAATPLTINQDLTISGAGAQKTIIDGGGITGLFHISAGTVSISNLTLRNGNGTGNFDDGGAVYNRSTLTLTNTVISGNTADSEGGGLFNEFGGTLTLVNSTVSGNSTPAGCCAGLETGGTLNLVNTTVSGNTASFASGAGGIGVFGPTSLINSTITGNSAPAGPGGGISVGSFSTVTLKNTLIANNTAASGSNCRILGTLVSDGHNLESANTCGLNPAAGDIVNTDPLLGPLQLNAGPTPTHALLSGSPAIDAGDNSGCPATDQRGVPRPLDTLTAGTAVCDIGAFEVDTLKFITLGVALNTATVHAGTPLQETVTVTNPGDARPLDVYVFFVPPVSGVTLTCLSSGVQTFTPMFSNVTLGANVIPSVSIPLFGLAWPAGAPTGGWLAGIAVTPAGAFTDQRVNPLGELVLATAGFVAAP
jgi:hypothetical protein